MKLKMLERIYTLHEQQTHSAPRVCHNGCAVCCTRNVTVTSLEAFFLLDSLEPEKRERAISRIRSQAGEKRLIPRITINAMAERCMNGQDLPDEVCDPSWGPCPLLENNSCTVYPFRPFACRAMVSSENCGPTGEAVMDEFLVTLNNVLMQYLEHMDHENTSANMNDMLMCLAGDNNLEHYRKTGRLESPPGSFLPNLKLTMLMVPPEYRERIMPVLSSLQAG